MDLKIITVISVEGTEIHKGEEINLIWTDDFAIKYNGNQKYQTVKLIDFDNDTNGHLFLACVDIKTHAHFVVYPWMLFGINTITGASWESILLQQDGKH